MTYIESYEKNRKSLLREGFTLIELMVTLLIIGIIAGGMYYGINTYLERGRRTATEAKLRFLRNKIEFYKSDTGQYPSALRDLVKPPAGIEGWAGTYIEKGKDLPKDDWDHSFVYRPTPEAEHPFELYSHGGPLGKQEPKEKRISAWRV